MAIQIICPGCHKRFQVSDKFAGQKGPCPQCKTIIQIPRKEDEVVVHAPEEFGPKNAAGQAVFKPIKRKDVKFTPLLGVAIGGPALAILLIALVLRGYGGAVPSMILALGAIILGPPLAWGGYGFLRDDELEPFERNSTLARSAICGLLYAALWGIYAWLPGYLEIEQWQLSHLVFVAPPLVLLGGAIGLLCFELDYFMGLVHYGIYVIVTGLLCLIMAVPLFTFGNG